MASDIRKRMTRQLTAVYETLGRASGAHLTLFMGRGNRDGGTLRDA